jgi:hypothetical protein
MNLINSILDGILNRGGISINLNGEKYKENSDLLLLNNTKTVLSSDEPLSYQLKNYLNVHKKELENSNVFLCSFFKNNKIYLNLSLRIK